MDVECGKNWGWSWAVVEVNMGLGVWLVIVLRGKFEVVGCNY